MRPFKIATLTLTLAAAGASIAVAMEAMAQANTQARAPAGEYSEGEIRTLYKEEGKVTLKHGEIKNLHMGAMTMVFGVKEKSMLEKLRVGDKVKFKVIEKSGELLITEIKINK